MNYQTDEFEDLLEPEYKLQTQDEASDDKEDKEKEEAGSESEEEEPNLQRCLRMGFTKEEFEEYKEYLKKTPKKIQKERQQENQRQMEEAQSKGEYFEHPGYWYPSHEFMEWDGQQRAAREPRDRINRRFPAQYEDIEEIVREENLEPDPEAQRLIDEKEILDAERKRQKNILNKKYRDKIKQAKKEQPEAKERKKREEEKSYMNWLADEQDEEMEADDDDDDDDDKKEQELLDPPSYVMESGYKPSPYLVPNKYEPGEQGECVICTSKGPVVTKCDNCPEGTSMYSPTNHPDEAYLIPPIDLANYDTAMPILDHMNLST
jgi:hypothetical protein